MTYSSATLNGSSQSTLIPLQQDVVVIGAGITGLTLGFRLQQQSVKVLVTEAASQPGGSISTQSRDGFLWEEGPNSFTPAPDLLNLIAEVGLAGQLVWADAKLPRYVYWEGGLLSVPMSPLALIQTPLLSVGGKLRALQGILGFAGYAPGHDETVREFFTRQLGQEVVERLVIPFVSGVYAGDADQLSAQAAFARVAKLEAKYGSLLAGFLQSPRPPKIPISPEIHPQPRRGQLGNFAKGLHQLPLALANQLGTQLQLGWTAKAIYPHANGYQIEFKTPAGRLVMRAKSVVITTPAYTAASLLQSLQPDWKEIQLLAQIPYPTVAVVTLGYPVSALPQPLQGFGHLIPRSQGFRSLGTIWASCLFPQRAPEGYHCFLTFTGGATDPATPDSIATMTPEQRADLVHRELSQILLKRAVDPIVLGERVWTRAIPQYTLGHEQRLHQLQEQIKAFPGLSLCANYLDGVALGDCVKRANAEAQKIMAFLKGSLQD